MKLGKIGDLKLESGKKCHNFSQREKRVFEKKTYRRKEPNQIGKGTQKRRRPKNKNDKNEMLALEDIAEKPKKKRKRLKKSGNKSNLKNLNDDEDFSVHLNIEKNRNI